MPVRYSSSSAGYPVRHEFQTNYNHQSPMYKYQKSLPGLPIPPLEKSCEKYLKSLDPLFKSTEERQRTRNAIDKFLKSEQSKTLQKRLIDRQAEMETKGRNWFIDWWNDAAYMSYRDSVVINVNYFFHFANDRFRRTQTSRAAGIISSAMKFRDIQIKQMLDADSAGRDKNLHGLCMHQYQFMFNTTRIPTDGSDVVNSYDPSKYSHVAVMRKGKVFTFSAFDASGNVLTEGDIEEQLQKIKEIADADGYDPAPLGLLTSHNRDIWTRARKELWEYSSGNQDSLTKLESAAFLVCLDDTSPLTREECGRALWHGDGRNRWFDKSCQFIIFENGKAGFNGEHSMMDATPTFRLCDYVLESNLKSPPTPKAGEASDVPSQLLFQYPENYNNYIASAQSRLNADIDRHDHSVLAFNNYGKGLIKNFRISPDSFVQLSIQLAYFKLFGESRATYESSQTKKYAWGRTEVCRSLSSESLEFVKAATDSALPDIRKCDLARRAIKAHSTYMGDAVQGFGVDRHFMGLKKALKPGEELPEIFTDPLFARSCHWNISTSQITSEHFDGWGWGEVVPDGYGIAYMIKDNSVHYNIAALQGGPGFEHGPGSWRGFGKGLVNPTKKMAACLEESLFDLKRYFEAEASQTKAKL